MEKEKYITEPKFFSQNDLVLLYDLENQQIKSVNYCYWVNNANKNESIELLDFIQFHLLDDTQLTIAASELCDCIEIRSLDIVKQEKELNEKFKGTITLKKVDKTSDPLWSRVTEYPLSQVLLDNNGEYKFFSDKLTLDFNLVSVAISITEMGLQVEDVTEEKN